MCKKTASYMLQCRSRLISTASHRDLMRLKHKNLDDLVIVMFEG